MEKLKFMMKINDGICASRKADGSSISGVFNSSLNEKKTLFRPLAIVGPSGAGKVNHFKKYLNSIGYLNGSSIQEVS